MRSNGFVFDLEASPCTLPEQMSLIWRLLLAHFLTDESHFLELSLRGSPLLGP